MTSPNSRPRVPHARGARLLVSGLLIGIFALAPLGARADTEGGQASIYSAYRQNVQSCAVSTPLVMKNVAGMSTTIVLRNESTTSKTVDWRLRKLGGGALTTRTVNLTGSGSTTISAADLPVEDGFTGSFSAEATECAGAGEDLSAVFHHDSANGDRLSVEGAGHTRVAAGGGAAVAGPNSPSAATGWTGASSVFTSDNAVATFTGTSQTDLSVTGYKFTIPDGSTVNGIVVRREGNGAGATAAERQFRIGLTKNGTALAGTRKAAQALPLTTDDTVDIGSATDLWGTTWTPAEINAATFGVLISDNDATAAEIRFDWVAVIVHHTPPVGLPDLVGQDLFHPAVHNDDMGVITDVVIHNLNRDSDVTPKLTFHPETGAEIERTITVRADSAASVDLSTLPKGFMSIEIEGPGGATLASAAYHMGPGGIAAANNAVPLAQGDDQVFLPLIFKKAGFDGGYNSTVAVQKVGPGSATPKITFRDRDTGDLIGPISATKSIREGESMRWDISMVEQLKDNKVYSAVVDNDQRADMAVLAGYVNMNRGLVGVYLGTGVGDTTLSAPYVVKNVGGLNSGIQVQSLTGRDQTVTIRFFNKGGTRVETITVVAPSRNSATVYLPTVAGLPDGFEGIAVLTAPDDIAAVVNTVRYKVV